MSTTQPSEDKPAGIGGCGPLARYPILSVVSFAAVGIGLGIGLGAWEPDDAETKENVLKWIGLLGDLFVRALKAVILPLVFCNVAVSVVDMMLVGRASSVGVLTIVLYTATTVMAATIGAISILCFKGFFEEESFEEAGPSYIALGCQAEGSFLTEMGDGSLMCSSGTSANSSSQFEIIDVTGSLARTTGSKFADLTMSETIYNGLFIKMITDNIFGSLVSANFAAVVIFAIIFGVAVGRSMFDKGHTKDSSSFVVSLFRETSDVLLLMINWIIALTPFAVFSLITKAIGSQDDISGAFKNVGYLMAASMLAFVAHFLITDIGIFYLATRENPFKFLKHIIPAQMTAFACASSAATLPVTLQCVKASGLVPDDIGNFVCPLGATINMDGSAIYFPCVCVWLAYLNGETANVGSYILLVILATIGSAGAAPVPSASLVLIITAYNTVFGSTGVPNGFEFVIAIDWLMDRFRTVLNVTSDTVVSRIITVRTGWDMEKEETDGAPGKDMSSKMNEDGLVSEEEAS